MTDVLLIIDVQKAILDGAARDDRIDEVMAYFKAVVGRLSDLKANAASLDVPIILIQNDGPDGHRLAVGSEGWEIVSDLAPSKVDIVVHKKNCDSFHETNLMEHLKWLGASRLVVGGCMTQYCVETTVRRAVSSGFDVALVSDGHCTGDHGALEQSELIAHHNNTLNGFDAGNCIVQVVPSAEVSFRT
ncbi:isochorismatase family protein [Celeribacter halophilus]|uniref:isochorismatase family protein n=1 Tax=Celeribacter halophilus TaxID=576117 RepID=UPI003A8D0004